MNLLCIITFSQHWKVYDLKTPRKQRKKRKLTWSHLWAFRNPNTSDKRSAYQPLLVSTTWTLQGVDLQTESSVAKVAFSVLNDKQTNKTVYNAICATRAWSPVPRRDSCPSLFGFKDSLLCRGLCVCFPVPPHHLHPSLFNSCSKRRMWCVIWSRKETSGTQVSAQFTPHLPQWQIFFLSKVSSTYVTT